MTPRPKKPAVPTADRSAIDMLPVPLADLVAALQVIAHMVDHNMREDAKLPGLVDLARLSMVEWIRALVAAAAILSVLDEMSAQDIREFAEILGNSHVGITPTGETL